MTICKKCIHYNICDYSSILDKEIKCKDFICKDGVVEVKHGIWKLHKDGSGTCNQCRTTQKNVWDYDSWQNYCGHCGAKMDK